MDTTVCMLKSMCELSVISQALSNKLINQYTSSDEGKAFVSNVIKGWSRKSYFIKEYEKRLFEDWESFKKLLKERQKERKRKQKQQQDEKTHFDVDIAVNFFNKKLLKIQHNRRMLLECLK